LTLADDVLGINWHIAYLQFGQQAMFDISAATPPWSWSAGHPPHPGGPPGNVHVPWPIPPTPPDYPGQAPKHQKGATGFSGEAGHVGNPGRSLNLVIDNLDLVGSLWIRTDGGLGGPGGNGGAGQIGGDWGCDGDNHCNGGDGGDGGRGGDGGQGGPTSAAQITINSFPKGYLQRPIAVASYCGTSNPPETWAGDDGRIVVWGAPGCGGSIRITWPRPQPPRGGAGGNPRVGGGVQGEKLQCVSFPFTNYFAYPGGTGKFGPNGSVGPSGDGALVEIHGPS